jgi:hypothetical protein
MPPNPNDPNFLTLTYPINSALDKSDERWAEICELVNIMPDPILDMVSSPRTAAFIRGLAKAHNLNFQQSPVIAYAVLQVAFGEKTLSQLAGLLSSSLKIANDKATIMASEIEKELFAPIMHTYNKFMQNRKSQPQQSLGGATNVLNLKTASTPSIQRLGIGRPNTPPTPKTGPTPGRLGTSTRPSFPPQSPQLPRPPQPRKLM